MGLYLYDVAAGVRAGWEGRKGGGSEGTTKLGAHYGRHIIAELVRQPRVAMYYSYKGSKIIVPHHPQNL